MPVLIVFLETAYAISRLLMLEIIMHCFDLGQVLLEVAMETKYGLMNI